VNDPIAQQIKDDWERLLDTSEPPSNRGGKRKGAGRPKADTQNVWLKIRTSSLRRLRAMIPEGKRSEFVSDLIDANL
jgi:hypothetical protein